MQNIHPTAAPPRTHTAAFTPPPLAHLARQPPRQTVRRRAVLPLLALTALPTAARPTPDPPPPRARSAARYLRAHCRPFLALLAPPSAAALLWRGAEPGSPPADAFAPRAPHPDLLDPRTYGPAGAAFFAELEARAPCVLPSRAHVATGDRAVAAAWGRPVTVWPVGPLRYAYWREGALLYDDEVSLEVAESVKGPLVEDHALRQAVAAGKEVLFEARAFVEVGEDLVSGVLTELGVSPEL